MSEPKGFFAELWNVRCNDIDCILDLSHRGACRNNRGRYYAKSGKSRYRIGPDGPYIETERKDGEGSVCRWLKHHNRDEDL